MPGMRLCSIVPSVIALAVLMLASAGTSNAEDAASAMAGARGEVLLQADQVIVRKGERRLLLLRDGRTMRSYRVSLGLNPSGHKEQEGDFRTPEGTYALTRRNAHSDFFLSIQVSYPNEQDARRARAHGARPGGNIMVHGLPNVLRYSRDRYLSNDWTDGCIALSNEDMLEVWLLTQSNTPILIEP
ncbi:MAG: L,D-transpeptidase family protein [Steroidobacteraceae bacterium]